MYSKFGKRLFDLIISVPAFLLLSPLLVMASVLIRIDSAGPIFFTQQRLGRKGRVFKILKFRSMTHKKREAHREIFANHPEVTRLGELIRRTKIDELPQLINIIKGDMTIVGPRPFLPSYLGMLTGPKKNRINVRPGLTGLAQINGNIHLSWEERVEYDLLYVEKLSLWLDIRIILKTFLIIFKGEHKFLKKPHE